MGGIKTKIKNKIQFFSTPVQEIEEEETLQQALNPREIDLGSELFLAIDNLKKERSSFVLAEIKMEKGISGMFRRLGLVLKRENDLPYVRARHNYFMALDLFRRAIIERFKKDKRSLFKSKINSLYRITVEDEITRVRIEKEKLRRGWGAIGFFRERVQEYREVSSDFKMVLGALVIFLGTFFYFSNFSEKLTLQFIVSTIGIIISLEGLQQRGRERGGISSNLNRDQAYRRTQRFLNMSQKKEEDLNEQLKKIHLELEQRIWEIRRFEKRAEYSRYLFAVLGGALAGALLAFPIGLIFSLKVLIFAISIHLFFYLLIPVKPITEALRRNSSDSLYNYPREDLFT